jgi:hypothetical protein
MTAELSHAPAVQARPVSGAWGWRRRGAGRAAHVDPGTLYQATTVQLCGLYPFAQGSGAKTFGVPMGRHLHTAEPVGVDPGEWLRSGLVTNTGLWVQAQPGVGKSTFAKRLGAGLVAFGTRLLSPGDTKGEYSALVRALDGQVVTIGRGLDRINPLDSGPIGQLLRARGDQLGRRTRDELADQVRARRLIMLEALCAIVRHRELREDERVLLGVALDRYTQATPHGEPTVGEIHRILTPTDPDPILIAAAHAADAREYRSLARPLLHTMELLLHGSIKGLFDGPSTISVRMDVPAVSLDISHLDDQDDDAVAAAMLCSWAWGSSMVDAARAAGEHTTFYMILDEMWRALRAAPGLVERSDRLTRLNRQRGVISAMITHSLDDLEALPTEQDRAKARGLIDRCGIVVLGGLPPKELDRLTRITPLTSEEAGLVTSWAAPPTWVPGVAHPGRGRYLIKSGERIGIPLRLDLVGVERDLYDTDRAWHERPALAAGHLQDAPGGDR